MTPFVNVLWAGTGITLEATSVGAETTGVTSHSLALPAGHQAGDVVYFAFAHAMTSSTITGPEGWTVTQHDNRWASVHRKLDGSEGASITVTTSVDYRSVYTGYRFSGAHGDVEIAAPGATYSLQPPSLTPAWGEAENAWITWAYSRRTDNTLTMPSGYGSQLNAETGAEQSSSWHCRIASAHRILTADEETPGAWGSTGTTDGVYSATVAIRPA